MRGPLKDQSGKLLTELFNIHDDQKILAYKWRDQRQGRGTMKEWKALSFKAFVMTWDLCMRFKAGKTKPSLENKISNVLWCVVKFEDEDFFRYYHANNWGYGWRKLPLDADYNFGGDYQTPTDELRKEMANIKAQYG